MLGYGHRFSTGQAGQSGLRALQVCLPCAIMYSGTKRASSSRNSCIKNALTFSYPAFLGAKPSRFETRSTCVSTEIVGRPKTPSRTSAVFGPTLGNSWSATRTSSTEPFSAVPTLPEYRSAMTLASCFRPSAFCLCKPATWIAFPIVRTFARLSPRTLTPTVRSRFLKALSAATSVQFCVRTVATRIRKGSDVSFVTVSVAKSFSRITSVARRTLRIFCARSLSDLRILFSNCDCSSGECVRNQNCSRAVNEQ